MILLLPDFVGHPCCFQTLLAKLPHDRQIVNYHQLPLVDNLPALAAHIAIAIKSTPEWIIGYSFGGILGYELSHHFACVPRLIMIDSHLPWPELQKTSALRQYQHWLTPDIRDWVMVMQELNEIDQRVILNNIRLFSYWQPKKILKRAWWIRCPKSDSTAKIDWRCLIQDINYFDTSSDHHNVMKDSNVISYLIQLIHEIILP
ncbi:thioesterase domain-containing protein [Xenorhabdus sp. PR6a]|uniref:thioesterase domain-containing protein n=1 Tax=Xenorhabdus sp. PR6a TaxID=3025877 RepID=UPI002359A52B|nr:thioesterase domain-containing protein [Xenorhabdus sp. PR6a]MDC9581600.1 thioesterase domain-containing protein [Xenorhabdus sp. PR6a]